VTAARNRSDPTDSVIVVAGIDSNAIATLPNYVAGHRLNAAKLYCVGNYRRARIVILGPSVAKWTTDIDIVVGEAVGSQSAD
jgi:hypothetical protein